MMTKPGIGRAVAVGIILGLAGCAVLLGSNNDGTIRRSLAATPPKLKNVRQETKNTKAAPATRGRSLQDDQDILPPNVISRQDMGAEVWLINQPKCGTGTLLGSLVASMDCEEYPYRSTKVADQVQQIHTYGCNNDNILTVTHTPESAMALRMELQAQRAAQNQDAGKCVVISSIRDPHDSIPSLWFWMNRDRYCEGLQSKKEVLDEYQTWLRTPKDELKEKYSKSTPHESLQTTAELLSMFGVPRANEALLQVLRQLAADGHTVIDAPTDGIWASCSLLLLQIDWQKGSVDHITRSLDVYGVEGTQVYIGNDNKSNCPKSEENYRHVKAYELGDGTIDYLSVDNPELKAGMTYYKEFQNFRVLEAALEGQSSQSLAKQMFDHHQ